MKLRVEGDLGEAQQRKNSHAWGLGSGIGQEATCRSPEGWLVVGRRKSREATARSLREQTLAAYYRIPRMEPSAEGGPGLPEQLMRRWHEALEKRDKDS